MVNEAMQARMRRVRWIWIGAALAATGFVVAMLWPRAIEVDVATADVGSLSVEIVDEGRTRMHDVYVLSAPVAGRVLRVGAEPGDRVAAGDVVARMARTAAGFLDTRTDVQARAELSAARARERSAAADADLAERELTRTRELIAAKLVSQAAADQAEARAAAARAAREAAAADVVRARSALLSAGRVTEGLLPIRAPVAGTVLRVPQESEAVIAPGTPLVEIGDPSRLEVVAEFLSQDAVRMRPGAAARIENWGGPVLPARVQRIEPVARTKVSALGVEEQRTNVILDLLPSPELERLGHDFRVDARVVVARRDRVLRVPLGALFRQGEDWSVFRIEDGRARLVAVQVAEADGRFRAIESGLVEGDRVIVFPSSQVVEGRRVKPRKSDAPAASGATGASGS